MEPVLSFFFFFFWNILKTIEYVKLYVHFFYALSLLTSGLCWERIYRHESGNLSLLPTRKSSYVPMSILTWSDGCMIAFFGMTVPLLILFCWVQRGKGEILCPVRPLKNCQFMKLLLILNGRLAAILFDQQCLQATSKDKNCKALIRNEIRRYLIVLEKGRAIVLQAYMIWRLPFAKLAEFPSCCVVLANIYWIVSQKLPEERMKLLNGEGTTSGIPDVHLYSCIGAQGQGPSRLYGSWVFLQNLVWQKITQQMGLIRAGTLLFAKGCRGFSGIFVDYAHVPGA